MSLSTMWHSASGNLGSLILCRRVSVWSWSLLSFNLVLVNPYNSHIDKTDVQRYVSLMKKPGLKWLTQASTCSGWGQGWNPSSGFSLPTALLLVPLGISLQGVESSAFSCHPGFSACESSVMFVMSACRLLPDKHGLFCESKLYCRQLNNPEENNRRWWKGRSSPLWNFPKENLVSLLFSTLSLGRSFRLCLRLTLRTCLMWVLRHDCLLHSLPWLNMALQQLAFGLSSGAFHLHLGGPWWWGTNHNRTREKEHWLEMVKLGGFASYPYYKFNWEPGCISFIYFFLHLGFKHPDAFHVSIALGTAGGTAGSASRTLFSCACGVFHLWDDITFKHIDLNWNWRTKFNWIEVFCACLF